MSERSYWLGFSSFSGIGPSKFTKLLSEFGTAKNTWDASFSDLEKVLGKAWTPKFTEFRNKFSIPDYEAKLKKARVSFLILTDENYPKLLSKIKKPPFVLYYKGNIEILRCAQNDKSIAIVGTRRITEYGKQVTQDLTSDLVNNGFVIVSGLALGVDAAAHKTTIINKGKTIAVLGCGVDCCYPRENQNIYNIILENGGAIVSEYPLGEAPSKGSFPSRNRIISGLSQGVLVTEGAADSGALYTAADAFENGRPVFAVPGPITSSLSKGPHGLISKGAKLISGSEEIIQELGLEKNINDTKGTTHSASSGRASIKGSTREEQMIIDLLENESRHFDEIVKLSKIKSSRLGGILSVMEMKGLIRSHEAGVFNLS
ncbi:MAG TPA: DNA-processing protein DprA [Candidatus Limnocylindrales bacterium]|nr:DNA-processing protein DprA [Candidatus Limnocylindrales bacterium]